MPECTESERRLLDELAKRDAGMVNTKMLKAEIAVALFSALDREMLLHLIVKREKAAQDVEKCLDSFYADGKLVEGYRATKEFLSKLDDEAIEMCAK